MATRPALSQALDGVRVLGFTQFLLGPACTRYLSSLGADVVKVEPLGGAWERRWAGARAISDGVSVFFLACNGAARSIAVDLKAPEGQEIIDRLTAGADVVVSNYRPRAARRLGITLERLREANPRVVLAKGTGYGEADGWAELPGQDLLLQARSGLMSLTGPDVPQPCGAAVVDQHAASLLAMGILAGLMARDRSGEAVEVEVTMMTAALDLMTEPLAYALNDGTFDERHAGLGSRFHPAPYGTYGVRDGHIVVSLSPVESLAEALDDPELVAMAASEDAFARRREIYDRVAAALRGREAADALAVLRAAGVWCERVQDVADVVSDPWVVERRWAQPAGEGGRLGFRVPRAPFDADPQDAPRADPQDAGRADPQDAGRADPQDAPRADPGDPGLADPGDAGLGRAPALGEHTAQVLASAGYTPEQVAALRARGVVR